MTIETAANPATITYDAQTATVHCQGPWTLAGIGKLLGQFHQIQRSETPITIDGSGIETLDSAGAWMLEKCQAHIAALGAGSQLDNFTQKHQHLIDVLRGEQAEKLQPPCPRKKNIFYKLGQFAVEKCHESILLLGFFGEIAVTLLRAIGPRKHFQWRALINTIDKSGYRALPIIALLSFLIGVVLTYQMGLQLKAYGANIYIVNVTGMAILREFAPLITAIILAGRTGSAFTAQIGTMKVNEEIDALTTMGLSPINRLVIPKLLGMMIAVPLLTVWASAWGMMGAMLMSEINLNIPFVDFINRFQESMTLRTYLIGLSKAPVFAMVIAMVGCFHGFRVTGSAESVGHRTTVSVVHAIFLIIVVDAIYSIIFSWQGI